MSPVSQFVFDGTKWQNEVVGTKRKAVTAVTTVPYPPTYGAIGSYRPAAATTGVPDGTTLTRYPATGTADYVVTTPGKVLDRLDIHGRVVVQAADVTIQRCVVRGNKATTNTSCIVATAGSCARLLIQDCNLTPEFPSLWLNGVNGHDFTIRRSEIRDVVDFFGLYNTSAPGTTLRVTIDQNWGHKMAYFSPDPNHSYIDSFGNQTKDNQTHNDGVQFQGGLSATVRGNSFESYYGIAGSAQPSNLGPTPTTAGINKSPRATMPSLSCFMFNNNVGKTGGHILEDNWLMGAYVPVNCGGAPGVNVGRMWRNRFSGDSLVMNGVPQTIWLRSDQICDTGDGTSNRNVFDTTGAAVSVKRNA